LLTDMAGLKQRLQAANDYNYQLKQQLTDSIAQMQQLQNEKLNMEQQLASAQMRAAAGGNILPASTNGAPPTQLPGGAVLRANNSLLQKMPMIQLPGVTTRMDGDVIRVDFGQVLQQVATAIRNHFPEQIVGVEAHWDNSPIQPATTTHHQLTASQCLAVFDYLSRIGLPDRQMFTMAMGSNRPRHPAGMVNGISPNRRIEIVIYPESYTGR
jgi:flagellar motor protein MotB